MGEYGEGNTEGLIVISHAGQLYCRWFDQRFVLCLGGSSVTKPQFDPWYVVINSRNGITPENPNEPFSPDNVMSELACLGRHAGCLSRGSIRVRRRDHKLTGKHTRLICDACGLLEEFSGLIQTLDELNAATDLYAAAQGSTTSNGKPVGYFSIRGFWRRLRRSGDKAWAKQP
jgi:hypothetical protein